MARLTIPDELTFVDFDVTTSTDTFPFTFSIFSKADLVVTVGETALDQSAFTLTGTLLDGGGYAGGSVVLNDAVDDTTVRIERETEIARTSNFAPANTAPVGSVDQAFNRLTANLQDIKRQQVGVSEGAEAAAIAAAEDALAAETAAAVAVAAAAAMVTGTEPIDTDQDFTAATFTLPVAVSASTERRVRLWVGGVAQEDAITCNGTTTATWVTIPTAGASVEGFVEPVATVADITPNMERVIAGGRLLRPVDRAARYPDVYDFVDIDKDGTDDGPGLIAALTIEPILTHTSGTIYILTDTTLPANCLLDVTRGRISIASGKTLTVPASSRILCPENTRVWYGTGEVRGLRTATAENFGAVGNGVTDDLAAWNKAIRASQLTYMLDKTYAVAGTVLLLPTLNQPQGIIGAGVSTAGGGSRFLPTTSAPAVWVRGSQTGVDAICEYTLRKFTVEKGAGAGPNAVLIAGDGGAALDGSGDKRLTGLVPNIVEDVHCSEFDVGFEVRSFNRLVMRNCTAISNVNPIAIGLLIGLSPGGAQTTEFDVDGCTFAPPQTGAGGGRGIKIVNSEVGSGAPSIAEIRGIAIYGNSQIYAGRLGVSIEMYAEAAVGKAKTMGDITFDATCKVQGDGGDGTISALNALLINARNGAKISKVNYFPIQTEGFAGDAIDARVTASVATFGSIAVLLVTTTFRYCKNRSIYADGVRGLKVLAEQEFCGAATGATANEHVKLLNCTLGRIVDMMTTSKDATWPGLSRGIYVVGTTTKNVVTRGNAMGTSSAYFKETTGTGLEVTDANTFDDAGQPSLIAQV